MKRCGLSISSPSYTRNFVGRCQAQFVESRTYPYFAMQESEETHKRTAASMDQALSTSSLPDQRVEPPLFTKDTLYHASLCCYIINTYNDLNYDIEGWGLTISNMFEEATMSIRGMQKAYVDRYMIAKRHGEDTYFVAFQSERTLCAWSSKYASFTDGLEKQTNRIPVQFFLELLNNKKRLVLTGFSLGGMMACHLAATLWKRSSIDRDILKKNIICITFGQPLIPIPSVEEAIKCYPQFETTIHAVYDKDDYFPRVLYYYNIGCLFYRDHGDQALGQSTDPLVIRMVQEIDSRIQSGDQPQATSVLDFSSLFAKRFLTCLQFIEQSIPNPSVEMANARVASFLKEFNRLLSVIIPHADKYDPGQTYVGNGYLMTTTDEGMQWASMPCKTISEMGILRLTSRDTELDVASFKNHGVIEYANSLTRSYLEREPDRYVAATRAVEKVGRIDMLIPKLTRIELQIHPNEHVLVLEGENLWFCHKLQLGEYNNRVDIDTDFHNVTQRMIRFNFPPSEKLLSLVAEGEVKVMLHSHFTRVSPVRQQIQVVQAN